MTPLSATLSPGKRPRSTEDGTLVATMVEDRDMPEADIENDPTTAPTSCFNNNVGRSLFIGTVALVGAIVFLVSYASDPRAASAIRRLTSPYGDISKMDANFASLVDPPDALTETAIFFHIPKAGGSAMESMYGECFDLTLATEVGGNPDITHGIDSSRLSVFTTSWGVKMVNVDSTSLDGLEHAKKLGLAESGLADIVFTSYIHSAAKVFSPQHRGRVFTIMRHPVERAASEFYYLQDATWESTYSPETKGWTLQQYAASDHAEHDWVTMSLLGSWQPVTDESFEQIKYILGEKFLIGLIDRMEESVDRFNRYFGWEESPDNFPCAENMLGHKDSSAGTNSHPHPKVEPGTDDWNALVAINQYDMKLYEFAVALFQEQGTFFEDSDDQKERR